MDSMAHVLGQRARQTSQTQCQKLSKVSLFSLQEETLYIRAIQEHSGDAVRAASSTKEVNAKQA